jgi:hypothetical protein
LAHPCYAMKLSRRGRILGCAIRSVKSTAESLIFRYDPTAAAFVERPKNAARFWSSGVEFRRDARLANQHR